MLAPVLSDFNINTHIYRHLYSLYGTQCAMLLRHSITYTHSCIHIHGHISGKPGSAIAPLILLSSHTDSSLRKIILFVYSNSLTSCNSSVITSTTITYSKRLHNIHYTNRLLLQRVKTDVVNHVSETNKHTTT